jgi:hypothetical protein
MGALNVAYLSLSGSFRPQNIVNFAEKVVTARHKEHGLKLTDFINSDFYGSVNFRN